VPRGKRSRGHVERGQFGPGAAVSRFNPLARAYRDPRDQKPAEYEEDPYTACAVAIRKRKGSFMAHEDEQKSDGPHAERYPTVRQSVGRGLV
jgi:hypothetical protein